MDIPPKKALETGLYTSIGVIVPFSEHFSGGYSTEEGFKNSTMPFIGETPTEMSGNNLSLPRRNLHRADYTGAGVPADSVWNYHGSVILWNAKSLQ